METKRIKMELEMEDGTIVDMIDVIKDIKETRLYVEALANYTKNLDANLVYNTIINQHILAYLVKDQRELDKIFKKASREARKCVVDEKDRDKFREELLKRMEAKNEVE